MRRITTLFSAAFLFAGLSLADDWNGKLIDASCHEQAKGAKPCDATSNTTAFIFAADGKAYKLDAAGNAKAAAALKGRADRAADPNKPAGGAVMAKVSGKAQGDTIVVESVEIP